jgi:hypothetical protein
MLDTQKSEPAGVGIQSEEVCSSKTAVVVVQSHPCGPRTRVCCRERDVRSQRAFTVAEEGAGSKPASRIDYKFKAAATVVITSKRTQQTL